MGKLAILLACSAMVGCSSVGVDCAPLESDGSRCVCPAGTVQVDDWVCELPDGGTLVRPGGPDAGAVDSGMRDEDSADSGREDAGAVDAGLVDSGEADVGVDVGMLDAGAPPDLLVACATPPSIVGAGEEVVVDYEVVNLGDMAARDFFVRIVAPEGTRLALPSGGTAVLAELRVLSLGAEETRAGTLRFVAPDRIQNGESRFDCVVDPTDVVEESDETNNLDQRTLTATGREMLSIDGSLPSTLTDGQRVELTVANMGPVASFEIEWRFSGTISGTTFDMDYCVLNEDCPASLRPGTSVRVAAFARVPAGGGAGTARFVANAASVSRAVSFVP